MIHELREEMGRDSSWTHVLVWHRLSIGNQARLNMTDWSHVLPLDLLWQNQPFHVEKYTHGWYGTLGFQCWVVVQASWTPESCARWGGGKRWEIGKRNRVVHQLIGIVSNIFCFTPICGKGSILTHIFGLGWNHQLGILYPVFFVTSCLGFVVWTIPEP